MGKDAAAPAVARLMAVELNAGLVRDQRLKKRLALDERQIRDVLAIKMQEIEGVIDEPHLALAVGRRLGVGEAGQSGVVDAAEFAIDVGGLRLHSASAAMMLGYLSVQSRPF